MNIDLKQLEGLLKVLEERDISEFEFEDEKIRVHLKRGQPVVSVATMAGPNLSLVNHPGDAGTSMVPEAGKVSEGNIAYVTSPFVGTFYRAPSPEAAAFVDVGSNIRPGQALCIVEAMKLMNEIEAEFAGTILECLVDTGSPVEFGQRLFKVKKA
ncbi:MAG TPA: acetyl-CoA carboxylase biotin carboxyl carrier protein [Polyangiaceae bacterium]